MGLFLLIFCTIYGCMHAYLLWKVHAAFPGLGHWRIAAYLFCVGMIVLAFAGRMAERAEHLRTARFLLFIAWVWLPVIFWFCCLGAVGELWNLGIRATALAAPGAQRFLLRPRTQLVISAAFIVIGLIWGSIEAAQIRLRTITIRTSRLAAGSRPIRIAHLTDLHLSLIHGKSTLQRVIALLNEAQPDLILATGDLVESPLVHIKESAPALAALQPPLGKFACTGNHEFYQRITKCTEFHERAGFRLLRGEEAHVDGRLRIVAVDDPAGLHVDGEAFLDEAALLGTKRDEKFTILLKHRPTVHAESVGKFDLQLSGHTHGGQIFPFVLAVRLFHPFVSGFRQFGNGSHAYVSRGAGTWGPPLRVLAPPEVTLFILAPEAPAE